MQQITGQKKKRLQKQQQQQQQQQKQPAAARGEGAAPATGPIRYVPQSGTALRLRPGMVLLKGALSLAEQQRVIDESFALGRPGAAHGGFYEPPARPGARPRLNQGHRGRLILPISGCSAELGALCGRVGAAAAAADPDCLTMEATTLLVNFYEPRATFKFHRDTERPDLVREGRGKPIVSLSVGESGVFAYKDDYRDAEHCECILESGDALVFGGPSRLIVHSVLRILPGTRPPTLTFPHNCCGRLNLTFREVTAGRIDTSAFPAYRIEYDIEEEA
eukprot:TRINITY_DN4432_c0_g1_i1.p1 TRINITY_DN4432_c0_g1~~TRINITY_DN4432_c0_g1_i1.p1  ORF type:complete len:310 (+),score=119.57 TRINITY_DN4432_c0_g1_i1:100-930(+)